MNKKDWRCKLGWHDPDTIKIDLVIVKEHAVANATIQCKKCGAFLTGISSKRIPLRLSTSKVEEKQ